jgi:para-nitrobenzyl esterase
MSRLILPPRRAANLSFSRRAILGTALAGGFLVACSRASTPASSGPPVVETSFGKIQGMVEKGVNVFKGVPYGASTAPPNRFRAPRAPEPWTGVKETVAYGEWAPQGASTAPIAPREDLAPDTPDATPRRLINNSPSGTGPGEDCLVLNVWTPALDGARRPVLVWLHGGGFSAGSGSSSWYDGVNRLIRATTFAGMGRP